MIDKILSWFSKGKKHNFIRNPKEVCKPGMEWYCSECGETKTANFTKYCPGSFADWEQVWIARDNK